MGTKEEMLSGEKSNKFKWAQKGEMQRGGILSLEQRPLTDCLGCTKAQPLQGGKWREGVFI